ncbi:MAG: hypothetical protein K8U03_22220 [Planctomycetia bacterium]|nr:hypothetical protein [Planctomycetia bacterium]
MERNSIYETLLKDAKPCVLPVPWTELQCHSAFVRLPEDLSRTIKHLKGKFKDEALIGAGVLVQTAPGETSVNPLLIEHGHCLLATEKALEGGCHQLVAGMQAIGRHQGSVAAALDDPRMAEIRENVDSQIFVAFSQADLAVAWSIGLPAIPSTGLENLGGKALDVMCQALKLRRSSDEFDTDRAPSGLTMTSYPVLINWSLAELAPKDYANAREVERHFLGLHRHLGVDLRGGAIWTPTAQEIETIKFRITFGQPSDVLDAIVDSSAASPTFGAASKASACPEPRGYLEALREWTACAASEDNSRRKRAWDRVLRFQESELITPLLEQAHKESELLPQMLLTALSGVSRMFHPQATLMSVKFAKTIRDNGLKASTQLPTEDFRQFVALADHMIAMAEGVHLCRGKKPKNIAKLLKSMKLPPTLKPSDSAAKRSRR